VSLIGSIISAIGSIGQVIKLGRSLLVFVRANNSEKWFQSLAEWIDKDLANAKSEDEYRQAARNLKRLLRR